MATHYLVEIVPGSKMYHLFPGRVWEGTSVATQDQQMGRFSTRAGPGVTCRYLAQKDGSRFRYLRSKKHGSGREIIDAIIRGGYSQLGEVYFEKNFLGTGRTLKEEVSRVLGEEGGHYLAYRVNSFLNGDRYMLLVVDGTTKTVFNVAGLFPAYTPEDEFGVLLSECEVEQSVGIMNGRAGNAVVYRPTAVDYRSPIRMCKCCGFVSDMSRPKKSPWLNLREDGDYESEWHGRVR